MTPGYEMIFVNDGSPDAALDMAIALQKDPHVVVVDSPEISVHHRALMTGLSVRAGKPMFSDRLRS